MIKSLGWRLQLGARSKKMDNIFPDPNLGFLFQVEVATEGSGSGLSEPRIEEPGKAENICYFK